MRRRPVNKGKSAKQFKRNIKKTKSVNVARPRRGGFVM